MKPQKIDLAKLRDARLIKERSRSGAGKHGDRRLKRQKTRAAQKRAAAGGW